jgi:hypothetical protein
LSTSSALKAPLSFQGPVGPVGPIGPTGPVGPVATGNDLIQYTTGPAIAAISGYSLTNVTGGIFDIKANIAINKSMVKGKTFDEMRSLNTIGTGYANLVSFSLDDGTAGNTGTFQNIVAKVIAISSPSGIYLGRWTLEQDYYSFGGVTNSFPTGAAISVSGPGAPDASTSLWTATMAANGATGVLMVRGHSGVNWVGIVQRIVVIA